MELIKIYEHVDRNETDIAFRIARMEDIWKISKGKPDEPHRHNFYTVLFVKHARAIHNIDFAAYSMNANQIFFVSPGQVHQIIEKEQSFGYAILFSADFLARNNIPIRFIEDLNLFNDYGNTPPLSINSKEMEVFSQICNHMFTLYTTPIALNDQALGSLLKLFLIHCNSICSIAEENTQNREAGNSLLKQFKQLVNNNYALWHSTSEYAEALFVSPDHLNRVVKSLTGKTAKEYIQSRIIIAAQRFLYFSDQSQKEIAYELGFSEPANFSAFFKKYTGIAPSQFRERV